VGCSKAKPDNIVRYNSPDPGVYYTVETYHGRAVMDSDFGWVYAHIERNGKTNRALVLDGEYLKVTNIIWTDSHENIICLDGGITNIYHNEVTLSLDGKSETIYSHLQEHCKTPPTASPASK
jgi:hypothetical protein